MGKKIFLVPAYYELSTDAKNFDRVNINFTLATNFNPFCNLNCTYVLRDLSYNETVHGFDFVLRHNSLINFNDSFILESYGFGKKIYMLDFNCNIVPNLVCKVDRDVKTSVLLLVNHKPRNFSSFIESRILLMKVLSSLIYSSKWLEKYLVIKERLSTFDIIMPLNPIVSMYDSFSRNYYDFVSHLNDFRDHEFDGFLINTSEDLFRSYHEINSSFFDYFYFYRKVYDNLSHNFNTTYFLLIETIVSLQNLSDYFQQMFFTDFFVTLDFNRSLHHAFTEIDNFYTDMIRDFKSMLLNNFDTGNIDAFARYRNFISKQENYSKLNSIFFSNLNAFYENFLGSNLTVDDVCKKEKIAQQNLYSCFSNFVADTKSSCYVNLSLLLQCLRYMDSFFSALNKSNVTIITGFLNENHTTLNALENTSEEGQENGEFILGNHFESQQDLFRMAYCFYYGFNSTLLFNLLNLTFFAYENYCTNFSNCNFSLLENQDDDVRLLLSSYENFTAKKTAFTVFLNTTLKNYESISKSVFEKVNKLNYALNLTYWNPMLIYLHKMQNSSFDFELYMLDNYLRFRNNSNNSSGLRGLYSFVTNERYDMYSQNNFSTMQLVASYYLFDVISKFLTTFNISFIYNASVSNRSFFYASNNFNVSNFSSMLMNFVESNIMQLNKSLRLDLELLSYKYSNIDKNLHKNISLNLSRYFSSYYQLVFNKDEILNEILRIKKYCCYNSVCRPCLIQNLSLGDFIYNSSYNHEAFNMSSFELNLSSFNSNLSSLKLPCKKYKNPHPVVLFLHGHSIEANSLPEFSLNTFYDIQKELSAFGLVDGNVILFDHPAEQVLDFNFSIGFRTTYYYDYVPGFRYILVASKAYPIDIYAIRLKDAVELALNKSLSDYSILVAHSMGGLVARRYTELFSNHHVKKIVMLGTPNHGIDGIVLNSCYLFGNKFECQDMDKNGLFMKKLNFQKNIDFSIDYVNIIGTSCLVDELPSDGIVKVSSATLEFAKNYYINGSCEPKFLHVTMLDPKLHPEVIEILVKELNLTSRNK